MFGLLVWKHDINKLQPVSVVPKVNEFYGMWGKDQLRPATRPNGNHTMCRCVNTPYYPAARYCWHSLTTLLPHQTTVIHLGAGRHFYSLDLEFYPVTKMIPKRWSLHWCLYQHKQYIPNFNDDFSCWLSLKQEAPVYPTGLLSSTCINTVGHQFNPHFWLDSTNVIVQRFESFVKSNFKVHNCYDKFTKITHMHSLDLIVFIQSFCTYWIFQLGTLHWGG